MCLRALIIRLKRHGLFIISKQHPGGYARIWNGSWHDWTQTLLDDDGKDWPTKMWRRSLKVSKKARNIIRNAGHWETNAETRPGRLWNYNSDDLADGIGANHDCHVSNVDSQQSCQPVHPSDAVIHRPPSLAHPWPPSTCVAASSRHGWPRSAMLGQLT